MSNPKKTEQIAWHTDPDTRAQVVALANLEGLSASEYLDRVLGAHITERRRHYECLHKVFAGSTEREEP